ncbi:PREDICTED: uncharacterized protein LOC105954400 [Erythranthe guttata]|uniref:uncharacterized protein LOC105954400 n=1 Tax=Erythranthe guttata TaxID=4155 RepID=UPI00064DD318|nr:PREDICTED: uncharacterized protein LOC105954400 [Erythranthe guttata]|eukprot:XP_012833523.1 PREDICTED: uncharacterized protein LOC105954400 [Erythranthe guttata]
MSENGEPRKNTRSFDSVDPSSLFDQTTTAAINLPIKKRRILNGANNLEFAAYFDSITLENISTASAPSAINGVQTDINSALRDRTVPIMNNAITNHTQTSAFDEPGSRYIPTENKCISKKLGSQDRHSLYLDYIDAILLTDEADIGVCSPCSFENKNTMTVFDGSNREYYMVLSKYDKGGGIMTYFELGGDWEKFVRANKLKIGDEVVFYHLDRDEKSYVVKYFKKPADRIIKNDRITVHERTAAAYKEEQHEANKNTTTRKSNPSVPDSTHYNGDDEPTLSKKLASYDVIKENAVLCLDYYEALLLTDDPEMAHGNTIIVYDEANRKYYMVLSKHERSGGRVRYELGGDWKYFVRSHNLKSGDELLFHQIIDEEDSSIRDQNCYAVRYYRKPKTRNK